MVTRPTSDRDALLGSTVKRDGEKNNACAIGDVQAPSAPVLDWEFPLQFVNVVRDGALSLLEIRATSTPSWSRMTSAPSKR